MSRKAFESWRAFVAMSSAQPALCRRWSRERVLSDLVADLIDGLPPDEAELARQVLGCLP